MPEDTNSTGASGAAPAPAPAAQAAPAPSAAPVATAPAASPAQAPVAPAAQVAVAPAVSVAPPAITSPTPVVDAPSRFPLSLDHFCTNLSKRDRRVELISAFHSEEKLAGKVMDTDAAFLERFAAFTTRKV